MVKKTKVQSSKHFLLPRSKCNQVQRLRDGFREIFPEGPWSSIQVNLELNGWTPSQIKIIQDLLRNGWSLDQALKHVSWNIGKGPIDSQIII